MSSPTTRHHPERQRVILSVAKDLARWAAMLRGVYTERSEGAQHNSEKDLATMISYSESTADQGIGSGVGSGVGLGVGSGVGLGVGSGVGLGFGVAVGVGLAVGDGVGVTAGVPFKFFT